MRAFSRHFEEIAGGLLLVAMCLIGAVKVVSRYVLASPLAWTEELATILFAWLVFIGASLALKQNEHFAIDVIVNLLPLSMRRHLDMLRHFAVLLFCLLLIGYGTRLAVMNWHVATPMLEVSRGWVYLSVPFGGLLMLVRTVQIIGRSDQAGAALPENSPGEESE
ncbi:MAG: TRAP transporter small permease [Thermoguttaceae bacterium]|jgi:TRAP-type C4-dicarboxylate transport system permease small subunit